MESDISYTQLPNYLHMMIYDYIVIHGSSLELVALKRVTRRHFSPPGRHFTRVCSFYVTMNGCLVGRAQNHINHMFYGHQSICWLDGLVNIWSSSWGVILIVKLLGLLIITWILNWIINWVMTYPYWLIVGVYTNIGGWSSIHYTHCKIPIVARMTIPHRSSYNHGTSQTPIDMLPLNPYGDWIFPMLDSYSVWFWRNPNRGLPSFVLKSKLLFLRIIVGWGHVQ